MKQRYFFLSTIMVALIILMPAWSLQSYSQNITSEGAWTEMTSMSHTRGAAGSCVIDQNIYVFGGWDLTSCTVYNTETDEWQDLANMSADNGMFAMGAINNKIYVVGGWVHPATSWQVSSTTQEFDIESNSWTNKTECPEKKAGAAYCVLDDKLYLLGGQKDWSYNDSTGQDDAFVYDPATDSWDTLPSMFYERGFGASANAYNNEIYVFGGFFLEAEDPFTTQGIPEKYNPETDNWTELSPMPIPVNGHVSILYDEKFYLFGGDTGFFWYDRSYASNLIQEYDPKADSWQILGTMPFNRSYMTGQGVGDNVYIFGGYAVSSRNSNPINEAWSGNFTYLNIDESKGLNRNILHQNYPNPFTSTTTISYDLINPGSVQLQIINMLGQTTATLVEEIQLPGNHQVNWNAKNIPAGVYLCKLKVNDEEVFRKIIKTN